jgi:hypothetical protein
MENKVEKIEQEWQQGQCRTPPRKKKKERIECVQHLVHRLNAKFNQNLLKQI